MCTVSFRLLNVTSPPVHEILLLEVLGTLASLEEATQSYYKTTRVQRKVLLLPSQTHNVKSTQNESNYYSTLLLNAKYKSMEVLHKRFSTSNQFPLFLFELTPLVTFWQLRFSNIATGS